MRTACDYAEQRRSYERAARRPLPGEVAGLRGTRKVVEFVFAFVNELKRKAS